MRCVLVASLTTGHQLGYALGYALTVKKVSKRGAPPDALGKLFGQLGTRTSDRALKALVAIGLPAIERLVEGRQQGCPVCQPLSADGRCFVDDVSALIYRVARAHPTDFVDYVLTKQGLREVRGLIGSLGATGDARALPVLVYASRDSDPSIRNSAVRAMGELGDTRANTALLELVQDRDDLVAAAAFRALESCGDAEALVRLEQLAKAGKRVAQRGPATGAADSIRRRLGLSPMPRTGGRRTMSVALDESHLSKRQRVGRAFRVHVKLGDRVGSDQRLAAVVTPTGECDLEAPFAGEVSGIDVTGDRVTVTVRELIPIGVRNVDPAGEAQFTRSAAWVLAAISGTDEDGSRIDLAQVIGAGDMLNHSILEGEELRAAFVVLQRRGIIRVSRRRVHFTADGKSVIEAAQRKRGGLFSRIDATLGSLKAAEPRLPRKRRINPCAFLTVLRSRKRMSAIVRVASVPAREREGSREAALAGWKRASRRCLTGRFGWSPPRVVF